MSKANLSGAILANSNLELVNLEGANLSGANLSHAKVYLTNLVGAVLLEAVLTGAKFAGEVCDETTILPDGSHWKEDVDWSHFGAIEELPEYARVKQAKPPKTSDPLEYENAGQREHDLKLLARLWKKMNSRNIIRLDDETQYRILEYKFYTENFSKYLYERHEHPELRFISQALEAQLQLYDEALKEFNYQLFQSAGVEDFHGTETVRPDYKLRGLERDVQVYKEKEWDKTIDKLLELRRVHEKLVAFLKKHFPEYDFFGDSSTESETTS